jgi:hypothetical protein
LATFAFRESELKRKERKEGAKAAEVVKLKADS